MSTTFSGPVISTNGFVGATSGSAAITTGTVATSLTFATGANIVAATSGAGTKIGTGATQKLGFWNATPVVQPATTGTATGFTAGSGTAVNDDSTFTGGVGTKAYRISDIVLALKQAGIMAAS